MKESSKSSISRVLDPVLELFILANKSLVWRVVSTKRL